MSSKQKAPTFNEKVAALKKQPAAVENPDAWREQKPTWSISKCDMQGSQWSWENIDKDTLLQILRRLAEHERRTWKEILLDTDGKGRKCNGSIEVEHPKIARDAKNRLGAIGLGAVETLWKFRIDGPGRVWGVREGRTLFIIWWDPNHLVYPLD